jgi:hypothetical protein
VRTQLLYLVGSTETATDSVYVSIT